jgi:hypothetical protein
MNSEEVSSRRGERQPGFFMALGMAHSLAPMLQHDGTVMTTKHAHSSAAAKDPRDAGPKPPQPPQQQSSTGKESKMDPQPDYGLTSYVGYERLKDRVAVVTGGDSGIGRAVALAFAREGADVVIGYLENEDDAGQSAAAVQGAGRNAVTVAEVLGVTGGSLLG